VLDLSHVPVVDVHTHPWRHDALLALDPSGFEDRTTMMGMCQLTSGSSDGRGAWIAEMTEATPFALMLRRRLARRLGVADDRDAVAAARHAALAADPGGYVGGLLADAGVAALICDEGYPQPAIDLRALAGEIATPIHRVGRIEPWIAELAPQAGSAAELEDAFVARLEREAADRELIAFKSVIAYRTGLDVGDPSSADVAAAFERWRADGFRESRASSKPVRDRLLRRTLEVARDHDRPVHIHTGGGDPDVQIRHAQPSRLFPLIEAFGEQPIVLIHAGWPWTEEAAFVASVLPHVFLDMSVMLPWASLAIDQKLEVLLGAAPVNKVMYGSDEASEPEVVWLSAQIGREALGRVLSGAIARGWLDEGQALRLAEGVLGGNALRLHGLEPALAGGAGAKGAR